VPAAARVAPCDGSAEQLCPGPGVRTDLDDESWVDYRPGWLGDPGELFAELRDELEWQQESISMFGRARRQPRLTAWIGERGFSASSRYAAATAAAPWPDRLASLRGYLVATYEMEPDTALANLYRDGSDSVGWHADDEAYLGCDPLIASLSLGGARRFVLRPRPDGPSAGRPRLELLLGDGDLLVMGGATQHRWLHGVPKSARPAGPRINVTLRRAVDRPSARAER